MAPEGRRQLPLGEPDLEIQNELLRMQAVDPGGPDSRGGITQQEGVQGEAAQERRAAVPDDGAKGLADVGLGGRPDEGPQLGEGLVQPGSPACGEGVSVGGQFLEQVEEMKKKDKGR